MILFKQYTITAAAVKLSDSTIFNVGKENTSPVTEVTKISQLIITNAGGAANFVYLGGSNVTNVPANAGYAIGFGAQPVSISIGPHAADIVDLRDIYIVGTVAGGNIVYMTAIF